MQGLGDFVSDPFNHSVDPLSSNPGWDINRRILLAGTQPTQNRGQPSLNPSPYSLFEDRRKRLSFTTSDIAAATFLQDDV